MHNSRMVTVLKCTLGTAPPFQDTNVVLGPLWIAVPPQCQWLRAELCKGWKRCFTKSTCLFDVADKQIFPPGPSKLQNNTFQAWNFACWIQLEQEIRILFEQTFQ